MPTTTAQKFTRKATFVVIGTGENREFKPVNKRAKTVVKKAGKRVKVSLAALRELVGSGSYTYHYYDKQGALKPIKL
jgi:hypothetical protein